MISSWLTLRDLEYLAAVAKHEHFGKAAHACHVSQPSLSAQIKKVEGYLGVKLFERTNRRVKISETGRKVVAQALTVLAEAKKIESLIDGGNQAMFDHLKIGVISSMSHLIPSLLMTLKKVFPRAQLTLQEGTTKNLVYELKSGALDAVISADTVKESTLKIQRLFFEPFVLAAPTGCELLNRSKIRTRDLKVSEMVLLEEGHCLRDQVVNLCAVNTRGNSRSFHANSLETLQHLVASGAGYTLLPEMATKEPTLGKLISYRRFDKNIGRNVVVACRAQSVNLSAYDLLMRTLTRDSLKWLR